MKNTFLALGVASITLLSSCGERYENHTPQNKPADPGAAKTVRSVRDSNGNKIEKITETDADGLGASQGPNESIERLLDELRKLQHDIKEINQRGSE